MAIKGKKGYFFTLSVIILLAVISLVMKSQTDPGYLRQTEVDAQRLTEINRYISAVEEDAHTALKTTGFRTFLAIDSNITRGEGYITENFTRIFQNIIYNGTYKGKNLSMMNASTLKDWNKSIYRTGLRMGLKSYFTHLNVSVWQEDPWEVTLGLAANITVIDPIPNAKWTKAFLITEKLSIELFMDPVFVVGTDKRYFQRFIKSGYANGFPATISYHILNNMYIASRKSPNFLQRLQGNFTASPTGVESLANVAQLSIYGSAYNAPIVDYEYFDGRQPPYCQLTPAWVRIPRDRMSLYNLNDTMCLNAAPSSCNNGVCNPGENFFNCPQDCDPPPIICRDGLCVPPESFVTCSADCVPETLG